MMGHFVRCRQPYVYLEVVEQSVRHHSGHEVLLEDSLSEPALFGEHGCVHVFTYVFMIDLAFY